ncbi:MAG: FMN-dependent NADH-azoreductase [Betaproteobacteria bacterium]
MKVLHLDSSILGDASVSRQLTRDVVQRLRENEANVEVSHRDLGGEPFAHLTGELLATRGTAAELLNELQRREARLDEQLVAELASADVIVIGAPLYNFTVPTGLKAWIDRIAVAGKTFRYTEKGPEGLVTGKKAIIVATSGGRYADSPVDHMHVGYVKQVLNFIGITDIEVVRAAGLALGEEVRTRSIADARNRIGELFAAETA